jgi:hypothetical protein
MAPSPGAEPRPSNPFLDWVEAIANRQGEVDLRLDHLTLRLPMLQEAIEVNGALSISMHLRELTEKERSARAAKEVRLHQV